MALAPGTVVTAAPRELTVLICTRNGARTIGDAVAHSIRSLTAWDARRSELIVVDNGSTDQTRSIVDAARDDSPVEIRLLSVPTPGKIHAFVAGVRAARADLVCIIDDDNLVDPDFFGLQHAFFAAYPEVGMVGGANALDPTVAAPAWFEWARHFLACTRPVIEGNMFTDAEGREIGDYGWIAGAGMGFRRRPLLDALDAGYAFFNDTQRGRGMRVTGEDTEMCLLYRSMGQRFGHDPRMRLWHRIAPDRLRLDAFWTLCRTIGAGAPGVDPFLFTEKTPIGAMPWKWRWQWQMVTKLRRFLWLQLPAAFADLPLEERRFRRLMAGHQVRGAMRRILVERSRYDTHIRNVASGGWTRYRVR